MNFDELINEICREFRKKRDKIAEMSQPTLRKALDDFWESVPWYLRLFRKRIMREVYRALKNFF